jgi:hypothetical protein
MLFMMIVDSCMTGGYRLRQRFKSTFPQFIREILHLLQQLKPPLDHSPRITDQCLTGLLINLGLNLRFFLINCKQFRVIEGDCGSAIGPELADCLILGQRQFD